MGCPPAHRLLAKRGAPPPAAARAPSARQPSPHCAGRHALLLFDVAGWQGVAGYAAIGKVERLCRNFKHKQPKALQLLVPSVVYARLVPAKQGRAHIHNRVSQHCHLCPSHGPALHSRLNAREMELHKPAQLAPYASTDMQRVLGTTRRRGSGGPAQMNEHQTAHVRQPHPPLHSSQISP